MLRDRYTVVLTAEPDGQAYNVTVPALPGCFTWGKTVPEALVRADEAIELYLDGEDPFEYHQREGDEPAVLILTSESLD